MVTSSHTAVVAEKLDGGACVDALGNSLSRHDVDHSESPWRAGSRRLDALSGLRRQEESSRREGVLENLLERDHLCSRALGSGVEDPNLSHGRFDYRSAAETRRAVDRGAEGSWVRRADGQFCCRLRLPLLHLRLPPP